MFRLKFHTEPVALPWQNCKPISMPVTDLIQYTKKNICSSSQNMYVYGRSKHYKHIMGILFHLHLHAGIIVQVCLHKEAVLKTSNLIGQ